MESCLMSVRADLKYVVSFKYHLKDISHLHHLLYLHLLHTVLAMKKRRLRLRRVSDCFCRFYINIFNLFILKYFGIFCREFQVLEKYIKKYKLFLSLQKKRTRLRLFIADTVLFTY